MTNAGNAQTQITFGRTWFALAIHAALSLLLFGLAINGTFLVLLDPKTHPTLWWMVLVVIVFSFLYPLYIGPYIIGRWRNAGSAIEIGPAGLFDRVLTRQPIPWSAFKTVRIVRTGGRAPGRHLMFDLHQGGHGIPGFTLFGRATTALNRTFGFPDHQVWTMGTTATVDKLAAAIEPYVPVIRN